MKPGRRGFERLSPHLLTPLGVWLSGRASACRAVGREFDSRHPRAAPTHTGMAEWVDALVSETSGDSPWGFDSLCRYSLSFGGWDCWEWSLGLHPGRQAGSMPASSTRTCTTLALVAQWTRVPGFEPGGWRFESSRGLSRWGCIGNAAIPSGCKPPASGSGSSTLSVPTPHQPHRLNR